MTITQRISLLWRRFSPLEEQLITAVRKVLPSQAQAIFDAQIAGITLVQRYSNIICFYRKVSGKVDWSGIPTFPHTGEFRLAEVRFRAGDSRFKATLTSISGHIFEFAVTPNPRAIAFAVWEGVPSIGLLCDPLITQSAPEPQPIPDSWRELIAHHRELVGDWTFYDSDTAFNTAFADGEFLVLAERDGDEFVLHRIEPPAATLFYLDSHDGIPVQIDEDLPDFFRQADNRNA